MVPQPDQKKTLSFDCPPMLRAWGRRLIWPVVGLLTGGLFFAMFSSGARTPGENPSAVAQNPPVHPSLTTDIIAKVGPVQESDATSSVVNLEPGESQVNGSVLVAQASANHRTATSATHNSESGQVAFHQERARTNYALGSLPEARDCLLAAARQAEKDAYRRATEEHLSEAQKAQRAGKTYFLFLLNESRRFAMRQDVLFAGMLLDSALARFPDCFGELARVKMFEASLHEQNQAPMAALLILASLTKEVPPQDTRYHLVWGRIAEIYLATYQVQDAKDAYFRLTEKAVTLEQESFAYLNLAHIAATVDDVPLLARCKKWMDEKATDSENQREVANLLKNTRAKLMRDISRDILSP